MRLQQMFGPDVKTAVQDPSYPVYVGMSVCIAASLFVRLSLATNSFSHRWIPRLDTSVMLGQTGEIDKETMQYSNIVYMPCTPENGFFPDYANHERADVVYICSPKYVFDKSGCFTESIFSNISCHFPNVM
jgi:LL-diaminopimelate aminotransferase